MFTPKIVGVANGASAGWGNLGGGATQLIMPVLFTIIKACNVPEFEAWRISFLIPGCAHIIIGFLCLQYGQVRNPQNMIQRGAVKSRLE
jgi:NNP family nitrate/nitrite transporter-like MFS transporter